MLGPFLVSFRGRFGSQNGGQQHEKVVPKSHSKTGLKNDRFLINLGVPFGVPNGARKVQIRRHKGLLSQVGSPGGPRGSPGIDFNRIFDDFWELFCRVVGHF